MRLSRDCNIYKRLENLEDYEKRIVIETELHSRAAASVFCKMYDTNIKDYGWKPNALNEETIKIMDDLKKDKQKYFKSILLLGEWYSRNKKKNIFTIEREIFGNFGHIPYDDNMGDEIEKLKNNEAKEYINDVWWDSEKKAILKPNPVMGSFDSGVNIENYYLEFSTGMTKKEAKSFAIKAIEELYDNKEKYQSKLAAIDFVYSIADLEEETITNTNWGDMLFIYDYVELYSKNRKLIKEVELNIHEELQDYHDYDPNDLKQVGVYSNSHVRNWIAKIRKEIE